MMVMSMIMILIVITSNLSTVSIIGLGKEERKMYFFVDRSY
jgi:hypothetical protein